MKAILLLLVASLLAGGAMVSAAEEPKIESLAWYYDSPCQQPEGTSLYDWLANLQHRFELETGGWDCSQTTAYVEWLCENCGHETVIACSNVHCWVIVGDDSYETTSLHWKVAEWHEATVWFQDIHGAWAWTEANGLSQWGWWVTHPELVP